MKTIPLAFSTTIYGVVMRKCTLGYSNDRHRTCAVLRKELQGYIAAMPEQNLNVLKPLLFILTQPPYIIEPASPSERKRIERRVKEYRENPSSFVPLK